MTPSRPPAIRLLIYALMLTGGMLRFYDLDGKSLWVDEAKAVQITREFEDILPYTSEGNTPPLRYYAMHYLQRGDPPELWIRLPSAIASLLCIPLMFSLGARLFNRSVGFLAAGLFTFAPWQIHHAQDGRMYAVFLLATILGLNLLVRAQQSGKMRWYALLGAVFAAGSYLNYFALWTSFIITLYMLACWLLKVRWPALPMLEQSRISLRGMLLMLAAAGVLYTPWLINVLSLLGRYEEVSATAPPARPLGLNPFATIYGWSYFDGFFREMAANDAVAAYGMALLAIAGLAVCWKTRRDFFLLSALWFSVPAIILLVSAVRWFFPPRYLIYYHPIYLLLVSVALMQGLRLLPPQWRKAALAVPLLYLFVVFGRDNLRYYRTEKQDWRAAAQYLELAIRPRDTVITGQAWTEQALLYYYRQDVKPARMRIHLYNQDEFEQALQEQRVWYVNWGPLPDQVMEIVDRYLEPVKVFNGSSGDIVIYRKRGA